MVSEEKIGNEQWLTLYSKPMERVRVFKYIGLWIDEKIHMEESYWKY